MRLGDPCVNRLTGLLGQLEAHRLPGLALEHRGSTQDMPAVGDIRDAKAHQIARPKLAVDGDVEQDEISNPLRHLQPDAHDPNFLEPEGWLLPDQLPLVPGGITVFGAAGG